MDAGRMTCLALLILSLLAAPISCSPWDFYDSEPPTDYQLQVGFIFSSMSIIMNGSTAADVLKPQLMLIKSLMDPLWGFRL